MLTFEERRALKRLISEARYAATYARDTKCAWCGEEFEPNPKKVKQQIYCSLACREAVNNERCKARQQAQRDRAAQQQQAA